MWEYFVGMLTLAFAVAMLLCGIFVLYFSSGTGRFMGGVLIVIGLLVGVFFIWNTGYIDILGEPLISLKGRVLNAVLAVTGAIVGVLIALGLFFLVILKR